MSKKIVYVVICGRQPGFYKTWVECSNQVLGYSCAVYKGFNSYTEAKEYFEKNSIMDPTVPYHCFSEMEEALFHHPPASPLNHHPPLAKMLSKPSQLIIEYPPSLVISNTAPSPPARFPKRPCQFKDTTTVPPVTAPVIISNNTARFPKRPCQFKDTTTVSPVTAPPAVLNHPPPANIIRRESRFVDPNYDMSDDEVSQKVRMWFDSSEEYAGSSSDSS